MTMLKPYLLLTIIAFTNAQDSTTAVASIIATTTINVTDNIALNSTDNNKLNVSRITQPSTNIERFSSVADQIPIRKNISKSSEFIPSPQLETYIEYNKFPVIPAFPEAKQLYSQFSYVPKPAEDKKGYSGMTQATMKAEKDNKYYYMKAEYGSSTTDKPEQNAQDKQLYPTSYDKPIRTDEFPNYKYYERYNYPSSEGANALYPSSQGANALYPSSPPSLEWYNKFNFPTKASPIPVAEHPYPFITDFTKKEAPVISGAKHMFYEMGKMAPWKRAAKIFAAILPIGLLISALTPNILTIDPVNTTQTCRKLAGRAEELGLDKKSIEKWSKPGCEARLLCETAIREDNMDAENVKKLFWSFVSQNAEDSETPEELEAVSNAIKEHRCDKITCRQIKKKSTRDNV